MELNPILACDGYKAGHILQYPKGLTKAYDNIDASQQQAL